VTEPNTLGFFISGRSELSTTEEYYDITDPNTGEVIAKSPCCTEDEVNRAVDAAQRAFPSWRDTPVMARVQVLYRFKRILEENMDA